MRPVATCGGLWRPAVAPVKKISCLAAWLPGFLAAWLPGCLAAWLPACLQGCLEGLPGCMEGLPDCLEDCLDNGLEGLLGSAFWEGPERLVGQNVMHPVALCLAA